MSFIRWVKYAVTHTPLSALEASRQVPGSLGIAFSSPVLIYHHFARDRKIVDHLLNQVLVETLANK